MADEFPEPIADGTVAQVLVRYTGPKEGAVLWRGPKSKSEYSFSKGSPDDLRWVLVDDLDLFLSRPNQFEILEQTRIDPEELARRAQERAVSELRAQVTEMARVIERAVLISSPAPRSVAKGRTGRPRRGEQDQLVYHLHRHCPDGWTLSELAAKFLDESYTAPATTMGKRLLAFERRYPDLAARDGCRYCQEASCPPRPGK